MALVVARGASAEPSCPSSDGITFTSDSGAQYQIYCGLGFQFLDLPMTSGSSFGACADACNNYQPTMSHGDGGACVGVVYSPLVSVCYLKYQLSTTKQEQSISGRLVQYQIGGPSVSDLSALGAVQAPASSPPSNPPSNPAPTNSPAPVVVSPAASSPSVVVAAPVLVQSTSTPTIIVPASTVRSTSTPSAPTPSSSSPPPSSSSTTTSTSVPSTVTSSTIAPSSSSASFNSTLSTTESSQTLTSALSTATTSLSAASSSQPSPSNIAVASPAAPSSTPDAHADGFSNGAKTGITIASAVVLIALVAALFFLLRRRQQRKKLQEEVSKKQKMDAWYRQGGRPGRNGLHELVGSEPGMAELSSSTRESRELSKFDFS